MLGLILAALPTGCATGERQPSTEEIQAHRQAVLEWRQTRLENLLAPDSWLSVIGLFWLEPGQMTFGTDSTADLVFPPHPTLAIEPGILGTIEISEDSVQFTFSPGTSVQDGETPMETVAVGIDMQSPRHLRTGPYEFFIIFRQGRFGLRLKDLTRAERVPPPEIDYFSIDIDFRVRARFDAYDPPRTLEVPTVLGTVNQSVSGGALLFELDGRQHRIETIESGERLMLVFADHTTGHETYGGGRYIYTPQPDTEGFVTIDFNTAYNPPCVFTVYATCFLPPSANRLDLRLEAGEKMVEGYIQH